MKCPVCPNGLEERGWWIFKWKADCRWCDGTGYIPENMIFKKNKHWIVNTLPKDCLCLWDFVYNNPQHISPSCPVHGVT